MKRVMSFTQLVELGYSRDQLKRYAQEEDFPGYKTAGGGKWFVYVDDLPDWIEIFNQRHGNVSETVRRSIRRRIFGRRKRTA